MANMTASVFGLQFLVTSVVVSSLLIRDRWTHCYCDSEWVSSYRPEACTVAANSVNPTLYMI